MQAVVAELFASLVQALSSAYALANRFLGRRDSFGDGQHLRFVLPRDRHDAVRVTAQDVSRRHSRIPDIDGNLRRVLLHAIFSGAH